MLYRPPTLTCGRVQIRTLQVISPRRTPSRRRFANIMLGVYRGATCSIYANNLLRIPCFAIAATAFLSNETNVSPPSQRPS